MISPENITNTALRAALKGGRLSHAYIVSSGETAKTLAAAAVCSSKDGRPCGSCVHCKKSERGVHPDIITVGLLPDKREIIVDQIRAVKDDVFVVPNEAEGKAYIINDADSMNKAAQNALLRVLEEPPGNAVFILLADNPAELLQTVRSRCVEVKDNRECDEAGEAALALADGFFTALESGPMELTEFSFKLDKLGRLEISAFIEAARNGASQRLHSAALACDRRAMARYSQTEAALSKAGEYAKLNVGAVHISGLLCAVLLPL